MKNLQEATAHLKEIRNPGHELGAFLLQHSNSPEYLAGQLRYFLQVVELDLASERALHQRLSAHLFERVPERDEPAE